MLCYVMLLLAEVIKLATGSQMLPVFLSVNRGGTNCNRCTQSYNIARTDLLMSPDQKPKTKPT